MGQGVAAAREGVARGGAGHQDASWVSSERRASQSPDWSWLRWRCLHMPRKRQEAGDGKGASRSPLTRVTSESAVAEDANATAAPCRPAKDS
jgi:hypothetical protein